MRANNLFKSDSQRLAFFTMRSVLCLRWYAGASVLRCESLLNALLGEFYKRSVINTKSSISDFLGISKVSP